MVSSTSILLEIFLFLTHYQTESPPSYPINFRNVLSFCTMQGSPTYDYTSMKSSNEAGGFWGVLARKAKAILDDDDLSHSHIPATTRSPTPSEFSTHDQVCFQCPPFCYSMLCLILTLSLDSNSVSHTNQPKAPERWIILGFGRALMHLQLLSTTLVIPLEMHWR